MIIIIASLCVVLTSVEVGSDVTIPVSAGEAISL